MPAGRPEIPAEVKRLIRDEAGSRCCKCGCPEANEFAHIIPWAESHSHNPGNLLLLCANCHTVAHQEKWGAETYAIYKSRPFVDRVGDQVDYVTLVIPKVKLSRFGHRAVSALLRVLSKTLGVDPASVEILATDEGSVIVTVAMPERYAKMANQPGFERDLLRRELHVLGLKLWIKTQIQSLMWPVLVVASFLLFASLVELLGPWGLVPGVLALAAFWEMIVSGWGRVEKSILTPRRYVTASKPDSPEVSFAWREFQYYTHAYNDILSRARGVRRMAAFCVAGLMLSVWINAKLEWNRQQMLTAASELAAAQSRANNRKLVDASVAVFDELSQLAAYPVPAQATIYDEHDRGRLTLVLLRFYDQLEDALQVKTTSQKVLQDFVQVAGGNRLILQETAHLLEFDCLGEKTEDWLARSLQFSKEYKSHELLFERELEIRDAQAF